MWWARHRAGNETYTRGHLFEVMWSTDIVLASITLQNSPFWTVHPVSVTASHTRVCLPLPDVWDPGVQCRLHGP